jgi:hypothetical protein
MVVTHDTDTADFLLPNEPPAFKASAKAAGAADRCGAKPVRVLAESISAPVVGLLAAQNLALRRHALKDEP